MGANRRRSQRLRWLMSIAGNSRKEKTEGPPAALVVLVLGLLAGAYAVILQTQVDAKTALLLLAAPFALGLAVLPHRRTILFALLITSLSFSSRFRPAGAPFRPGGAELALAPLDLVLISLALPVFINLARGPWQLGRQLGPLRYAFLFFFAAHIPSLLVAPDRGYAILEIVRLMKMALLLLVIVYYTDSIARLRTLLVFLFVVMIAQGLLAVSQSLFRTSLGLDALGEHEFWNISLGGITIGRAGGTLGHANVLANFFEVTAPIALAITLSQVRGYLRPLAYAALGFGIVGAFFSFSRAGWAALAIGLALALLQSRRRVSGRRILQAIVLTGIIGAVIAFLFRDVIAARLFVFWEGSKTVRVITAETAFNMIRSHPLLGVGANNYTVVSSQFVGSLSPGLRVTAAALVHNILLLYLAELGIVGLIAFIVLIIAIVRLARRVSNGSEPVTAAVGAGIFGGLIALLAHGMWDWLFRYDPVFTLFWFFTGFLLAAWHLQRHPAAQSIS